MFAVPEASNSRPSPSDVEVLLLNVVPVIVSMVKVPLLLRIVALLLCDPLMVELVMLAVPKRLLKSSPFSPSTLPLFVTRLFVSEKPVTLLPRIPSSPPPVTRIRERLTLDVLLKLMPAPVELWMVPPVQVGVATVQAPPLPLTVSPPLDPVLLSTIPFAAPFDA